jgi:hypothetical protein
VTEKSNEALGWGMQNKDREARNISKEKYYIVGKILRALDLFCMGAIRINQNRNQKIYL